MTALRRCLAALSWLLCAAAADAACPPTAQAPTAEQLQAGAQNARDHGFLWRISKDGRSSYLYGTIHVGKLEWIFPGRTVAAALRDTDTLALEIDLDAAQAQAAAPHNAGPPLPAALRERLERQIAAACVPRNALAGLHPVMQAVTLTVLAARWDGLDPAFAQEVALAGAARAMAHPIVALETPASQMATLVPREDKDALAMLEQTLTQLEGDQVRTVLVRLASAWEHGNLGDLEHYESWCRCANTDEERAFMRRLNDDRNPQLAERIDALHGSGKKVFAAVGALHMTGAKALPALLARRGYAVERVRMQ